VSHLKEISILKSFFLHTKITGFSDFPIHNQQGKLMFEASLAGGELDDN